MKPTLDLRPAGAPRGCGCALRDPAPLAAAALALLLAFGTTSPAVAAPGGTPVAPGIARFLAGLPDEAAETLGRGEDDDPVVRSRAQEDRDFEREQALSDQTISRFAKKKLTNMRFCFSMYTHVYREIKEGSAGWGHWDDLFESGAFATRVHAGENSIWLPTGGFEISYICMPLYHVSFGIQSDLYTGRHFLGNEFQDLRITSYFIGWKFNLLNEYTALQQFAEMLESDQPKHITGPNLYLRGTTALCIIEPVLYKGAFLPPGQTEAHYFTHGTTLGTYVGAGFEYRLFTIGLYFEAGYSEIRHPPIGPGPLKVNHLRTFPVQAGINVYFGG